MCDSAFTLDVPQTERTIPSQLIFEPVSLVWRAGSLPTKPSKLADLQLGHYSFEAVA